MKLAIIIEGDQNSGKTSTIRGLINKYSDKSISQMKRGWQRLFLNETFKYLKIDVYCVPASPSETGIELNKRFPNWKPDILIVAEQPSGQFYKSSYNFLNNNNYNILTYSIKNQKGKSNWERFDKNDKTLKLTNRANEIINDVRNFIKNNQII